MFISSIRMRKSMTSVAWLLVLWYGYRYQMGSFENFRNCRSLLWFSYIIVPRVYTEWCKNPHLSDRSDENGQTGLRWREGCGNSNNLIILDIREQNIISELTMSYSNYVMKSFQHGPEYKRNIFKKSHYATKNWGSSEQMCLRSITMLFII